MTEKNIIRSRVWANLRTVASPDSRFHWDFSAFIPDFEGSDRCAQAVRTSPLYSGASCIFITPDNSLISLRTQCILDQKQLIIPTYGIQRGFWQLQPGDVPPGQEAFGATLDGLEKYGRPYILNSDSQISKPDVLITGASILNPEGMRISDTPSYFDLEWFILVAFGLVDESIPILACVHNYQVIDFKTLPAFFTVVVDWIYTPDHTIETHRAQPRPKKDDWSELPWQVIQDIPILTELYTNQLDRT